jgi:uncharacterized protein involved in exopolysaccharide biosynthesis
MARYRETLRRQHWLLLGLPIIVSVLFAGWFAFGAAAKYRSTVSLWIDNGPTTGSSLYAMPAMAAAAALGHYDQATGPADAERLLLAQSLADPKFDLEVSHDSLLPGFIASGAGTGFSPLLLLKRNPGSPSYQATLSVATQVMSKTRGPQVLQLTYAGPTPAVARSVLVSLVQHLQHPSTSRDTYSSQEPEFLQQARRDSARAVAGATASAAAYKRNWPSATAQTDPNYAALLGSVKTAKTALATATAASASVHSGSGTGTNASIRVVDPPSLPSGPVVSPIQIALSLLGGLFAGLVISLLLVFVATPSRQQPWDGELSTAPWTRVTYSRKASRRRQPASSERVSAGSPRQGVA